MADLNGRGTDGAPPKHIHIEKKGVNWLAWLLLAAGILAALFALSRCDRKPARVDNHSEPTAAPANEVIGATEKANESTVLASSAGLGTYLASSEPLPRRFTFETLSFDTAKSEIRAADATEVGTVAGVLKQYPTSHVRIAGYADARGSTPANLALGKARADSVKAALVAKGIDAGRIETASGGEADPVDTNATAPGQAENRRTEIIVTKR